MLIHACRSPSQQYALVQWLAVSRGLTTISVNYRSGVGYGAGFRLCPKCMAKGAAEYADIRTAAKVLLGEHGVKASVETQGAAESAAKWRAGGVRSGIAGDAREAARGCVYGVYYYLV